MAYTLLVWDNVCCFLSASQEELAVKQILKVAVKSERSGMRNVCPSHEQRIRHAQFWYKHHATKNVHSTVVYVFLSITAT